MLKFGKKDDLLPPFASIFFPLWYNYGLCFPLLGSMRQGQSQGKEV